MASPRDHYGVAQRQLAAATEAVLPDQQEQRALLLARAQAESLQGILLVLSQISNSLDSIQAHQR